MILDNALKSDAREQIGQRRHYNRTTRLKTENRLGSSSVAGCLPKRPLSSLFSAHCDKSTATMSGATVVWAGVGRRRAGQEGT